MRYLDGMTINGCRTVKNTQIPDLGDGTPAAPLRALLLDMPTG